MATIEEAEQQLREARENISTQQKNISDYEKEVSGIEIPQRTINFQMSLGKGALSGRVEQTIAERKRIKKEGLETVQRERQRLKEYEENELIPFEKEIATAKAQRDEAIKQEAEYKADVQTVTSAYYSSKPELYFGLTPRQRRMYAELESGEQLNEEFNTQVNVLKNIGINPIFERKGNTLNIVGFEDSILGKSYAYSELPNLLSKRPDLIEIYEDLNLVKRSDTVSVGNQNYSVAPELQGGFIESKLTKAQSDFYGKFKDMEIVPQEKFLPMTETLLNTPSISLKDIYDTKSGRMTLVTEKTAGNFARGFIGTVTFPFEYTAKGISETFNKGFLKPQFPTQTFNYGKNIVSNAFVKTPYGYDINYIGMGKEIIRDPFSFAGSTVAFYSASKLIGSAIPKMKKPVTVYKEKPTVPYTTSIVKPFNIQVGEKVTQFGEFKVTGITKGQRAIIVKKSFGNTLTPLAQENMLRYRGIEKASITTIQKEIYPQGKIVNLVTPQMVKAGLDYTPIEKGQFVKGVRGQPKVLVQQTYLPSGRTSSTLYRFEGTLYNTQTELPKVNPAQLDTITGASLKRLKQLGKSKNPSVTIDYPKNTLFAEGEVILTKEFRINKGNVKVINIPKKVSRTKLTFLQYPEEKSLSQSLRSGGEVTVSQAKERISAVDITYPRFRSPKRIDVVESNVIRTDYFKAELDSSATNIKQPVSKTKFGFTPKEQELKLTAGKTAIEVNRILNTKRSIPKYKAQTRTETITGVAPVVTEQLTPAFKQPQIQLPKTQTRDTFRIDTATTIRPIESEITRQVPREITRDVNRELSRTSTREITRETTRETTRTISRNLLRFEQRLLPRDLTRQLNRLQLRQNTAGLFGMSAFRNQPPKVIKPSGERKEKNYLDKYSNKRVFQTKYNPSFSSRVIGIYARRKPRTLGGKNTYFAGFRPVIK